MARPGERIHRKPKAVKRGSLSNERLKRAATGLLNTKKPAKMVGEKTDSPRSPRKTTEPSELATHTPWCDGKKLLYEVIESPNKYVTGNYL